MLLPSLIPKTDPFAEEEEEEKTGRGRIGARRNWSEANARKDATISEETDAKASQTKYRKVEEDNSTTEDDKRTLSADHGESRSSQPPVAVMHEGADSFLSSHLESLYAQKGSSLVENAYYRNIGSINPQYGLYGVDSSAHFPLLRSQASSATIPGFNPHYLQSMSQYEADLQQHNWQLHLLQLQQLQQQNEKIHLEQALRLHSQQMLQSQLVNQHQVPLVPQQLLQSLHHYHRAQAANLQYKNEPARSAFSSLATPANSSTSKSPSTSNTRSSRAKASSSATSTAGGDSEDDELESVHNLVMIASMGNNSSGNDSKNPATSSSASFDANQRRTLLRALEGDPSDAPNVRGTTRRNKSIYSAYELPFARDAPTYNLQELEGASEKWQILGEQKTRSMTLPLPISATQYESSYSSTTSHLSSRGPTAKRTSLRTKSEAEEYSPPKSPVSASSSSSARSFARQNRPYVKYAARKVSSTSRSARLKLLGNQYEAESAERAPITINLDMEEVDARQNNGYGTSSDSTWASFGINAKDEPTRDPNELAFLSVQFISHDRVSTYDLAFGIEIPENLPDGTPITDSTEFVIGSVPVLSAKSSKSMQFKAPKSDFKFVCANTQWQLPMKVCPPFTISQLVDASDCPGDEEFEKEKKQKSKLESFSPGYEYGEPKVDSSNDTKTQKEEKKEKNAEEVEGDLPLESKSGDKKTRTFFFSGCYKRAKTEGTFVHYRFVMLALIPQQGKAPTKGVFVAVSDIQPWTSNPTDAQCKFSIFTALQRCQPDWTLLELQKEVDAIHKRLEGSCEAARARWEQTTNAFSSVHERLLALQAAVALKPLAAKHQLHISFPREAFIRLTSRTQNFAAQRVSQAQQVIKARILADLADDFQHVDLPVITEGLQHTLVVSFFPANKRRKGDQDM